MQDNKKKSWTTLAAKVFFMPLSILVGFLCMFVGYYSLYINYPLSKGTLFGFGFISLYIGLFIWYRNSEIRKERIDHFIKISAQNILALSLLLLVIDQGISALDFDISLHLNVATLIIACVLSSMTSLFLKDENLEAEKAVRTIHTKSPERFLLVLKWKDFLFKNEWPLLGLLLILLVNVISLIYQWPYIHSYWIDEWISIKSALLFGTSSFPYFPSGNPLSSGYVYFFLLHIAEVITNNYLHAGRILNLLFFTAAFFAIFKLIRDSTNQCIGLIAMALLSTSYFLLTLENEVRGYLFSLLLFYLIILCLKEIRNKFYRFLIPFILLIVLLDNNLTNIWFVFVGFLIGGAYILIEKRRSYYKPYVVALCLFPILAILAYKGNPLEAMLFYYNKLIGGLPGWAAYKENFFYPYYYLIINTASMAIYAICLPAIAYLLFSKYAPNKSIFFYLFSVLVLSLVPIMLTGTPDGFRYFFLILPIWLFLIAILCSITLSSLESVYQKIIIILLTVSILLTSITNAQNVLWAQTLNYIPAATWITNQIKVNPRTIVITNYVGVDIDQYNVPISYILYDQQIFYYYENAASYLKKNILGYSYKAPVGESFLLNADYLNLQGVANLKQERPGDEIIIFIRPWPTDITNTTYDNLEKIGFIEMIGFDPFKVFISK